MVMQQIRAMGAPCQKVLVHGISRCLIKEPIKRIKDTIGDEYSIRVVESFGDMVSCQHTGVTIVVGDMENIIDARFMKQFNICVVFTPVNGIWGAVNGAYTQCVSYRDKGGVVHVANFK